MATYFRRLPLASVAVSAALIGGCGGSSSDHGATTDKDGGDRAPTAATRDGGTLKVALAGDADTLDPTSLHTVVAWQALSPMCDSLYRLDKNARPQPSLATAVPELSADGLTATIKLRSGVKFNDGTVFDAAAVKASLQLAKKQSAYLGAPIKSINASAPDTVVIHLTKPYAPLKADLAGPGGMIVSPAQVKKLGKKFGTHPVCVGPFRFTRRVAGDSITLSRSPLYYDADRIKLDSIQFKIIPDPNARIAAVQSGEVQVAESANGPDLPRLEANADLVVAKSTGLGWQGLFVNVGNSNGVGKPIKPRNTPLAKSAEVRQAFSLAIDRDAIAKLQGGGTVAGCSPISPVSDLYEKPACPKRDVAKAKELIQKSGVSTPIKATLVAPLGKDSQRIMQAIQSMVREVGFDVKIDTCDVAACVGRALAGNFDLAEIQFSGLPDPDANISPFFLTGSFLGFSGMPNPKVDDLLAQAREANDPQKRVSLYKQGLDTLRADGSIVFFGHPGYDIVARKDVTGYEFTPAGLTFYQNAAFIAKS
jgi:peptide/nickel transport system substrate-binding protein